MLTGIRNVKLLVWHHKVIYENYPYLPKKDIYTSENVWRGQPKQTIILRLYVNYATTPVSKLFEHINQA